MVHNNRVTDTIFVAVVDVGEAAGANNNVIIVVDDDGGWGGGGGGGGGWWPATSEIHPLQRMVASHISFVYSHPNTT